MKKPFKFTERNANVVCANPNCSKIRGAEGVSRMPIKKNVISRSPDGNPLFATIAQNILRLVRRVNRGKAQNNNVNLCVRWYRENK